MKFIVARDGSDRSSAKAVTRILKMIKNSGNKARPSTNLHGVQKGDADMVISVGSSSNILKTFRELDGISVPVLGVSAYMNEFLPELTVEQFETMLPKILKLEYEVEERSRIEVIVDEKPTPPVLNDLVIAAKRSASILSYSIVVDGIKIINDTGDGIIISTPNGSTGYSASAGGPIISSDSKVIALTPISSMTQARPMVFSENSVIKIKDINSGFGVELISDGRFRSRLRGNEILIRKYEEPARFVVFKEFSRSSVEKLKKRQDIRIDDVDKAPPSAKFIIKLLEYEGPLTQKDIVRLSSLQARTVRHGLSYLKKKDIIEERRSLQDARYSIYHLK